MCLYVNYSCWIPAAAINCIHEIKSLVQRLVVVSNLFLKVNKKNRIKSAGTDYKIGITPHDASNCFARIKRWLDENTENERLITVNIVHFFYYVKNVKLFQFFTDCLLIFFFFVDRLVCHTVK